MNVAITVWDTRISPVFDAAETLLIAEVQQTEIVDRKILRFQAGRFDRFVRLLDELNVQVLICGALCAGPANLLESHDINVISFLTGDAEEVLQLYVQGKELDAFAMPGCGWRRCCRLSRGEEGGDTGERCLGKVRVVVDGERKN